MTQKERMLAGLPYKAWLDGLSEERMACRRKLHAFNLLPPDEEEQAQRLLLELLGKTGRDPWINAPFHCDYGWNIEVGDNFFANYNLTILDVGKVTIGSNVQFAPNVSIYTAGHPLHPDSRNSGYEYGLPVTIGDNVWIGGNVVLLPGVTVGSNSVIGAGSVVSRDIPEWVVAVGSPCRVVRRITEEDLPELLALAKDNPTYYRYMGEEPTLEGLRGDLTKLPPRTTSEDKYFLGYFRDGRLWGALDLILHFPNPETAFVGWFILRKDLQGRGVGTALVSELMDLLKDQGFRSVRLGRVKGNPESEAFWVKNQFTPTGIETDGGGYTIVVMQREL